MSYTYLGIPKIVLFPFLTGVSSGGGGGGGSDGSLATAAPFAATSKNGSRCQLDLNFKVYNFCDAVLLDVKPHGNWHAACAKRTRRCAVSPL